jgi:UDP-glucose 4-epimerase
MAMNHCCLIGGGGFIGLALTDALLAQGRQVTILDTRPAPARVPRAVAYLVGDYARKDILRKALIEVDAVINLSYASVPTTSFADPIQDILSNLPAAVGLFQTAAEFPIKKIVMISSGGTVYGPAQRLPITEDHATDPISPYGVTKLAIEKYGNMFYRLKDLPVVTVRPANAFGEHQNPFVGQGFIAAAMAAIINRKSIILYGMNGTVRDYVHVEDVASGILAALDHGRFGETYNIGSGEGRTNKDVLDEIRPHAQALGLPLHVTIEPARGFDVEANVLDSAKLHADSGWKIGIPFGDGIRRTWNWFAKNQQVWNGLKACA